MSSTRREWLQQSSAALAALLVGNSSGCGDNWLGLDFDAFTGYDGILDAVHDTHPEFSIGLSNHAPMAMDALVALGRADRVGAWAVRYVNKLELLAPGAPIAETDRAGALGDHARQADWIATYVADAETIAPRELIARDIATLLPAWSSTHGMLRVTHALRALEREDTLARRRELAHGLGYWACRYDLLPGEPGAQAVAGRDVASALAAVPLVPESRRSDAKLIVDRLAPLASEPDFIAAVEALDLDAQPVADALHELLAAAARIYVADGRNEISLLHGVTGTAALSLLLPYLDATAQRAAVGYAFQAVAAIHATHSRAPGVPATVTATRRSATDLAEAGGARNDEHEIKLTEAVLRMHADDPRPELLAAAALVQG